MRARPVGRGSEPGRHRLAAFDPERFRRQQRHVHHGALGADDPGAAFFEYFRTVVSQSRTTTALTKALAEAGIDAAALAEGMADRAAEVVPYRWCGAKPIAVSRVAVSAATWSASTSMCRWPPKSVITGQPRLAASPRSVA